MPARKRFLFWLLVAVATGLVLWVVAHRSETADATASSSSQPIVPARVEAPAERAAPSPLPITRPANAAADQLAFEAMQSLVDENQISAARARAARFFEEFPESPYGERVERLTGVHPRPQRP